MKFFYHITFSDGSNPYFSLPAEAEVQIKAIKKWMKKFPMSKYDIFAGNYKISNTTYSTWVVYKCGNYVDTPLKKYSYLASAVKYLKKILEG